MEPLWITLRNVVDRNDPAEKVNAHEIRRIHITHKKDNTQSTPDWHVSLDLFSGEVVSILPAHASKQDAIDYITDLAFQVSIDFARIRADNHPEVEFFCPTYLRDANNVLQFDLTRWLNRISRATRIGTVEGTDEWKLWLYHGGPLRDLVAAYPSEAGLREPLNRYTRHFGAGNLT